MTPKNQAFRVRPIKKGDHLLSHCGGGSDKKAPSDGYVLTFSTAFIEKDYGRTGTTEDVFVSAALIKEATTLCKKDIYLGMLVGVRANKRHGNGPCERGRIKEISTHDAYVEGCPSFSGNRKGVFVLFSDMFPL